MECKYDRVWSASISELAVKSVACHLGGQSVKGQGHKENICGSNSISINTIYVYAKRDKYTKYESRIP